MDGEWGRTVTQTFATLWVARAGATPGVGPQLVILVRPPLAPSAKVDPVRVTPSPCPPRAAPPFIPRGNATEDRRHGPSCCWGGVPSRGSTSTCHGSGRPSPVYTPSCTRRCRRGSARPRCCRGSPGRGRSALEPAFLYPMAVSILSASTPIIGLPRLQVRVEAGSKTPCGRVYSERQRN